MQSTKNCSFDEVRYFTVKPNLTAEDKRSYMHFRDLHDIEL